jgi:hypothetical protein
MRELVKALVRADGKRRVLIEKRPDGLFTFVVETLVYHYDEELRERLQDYEMICVPTDFGGIHDTQEAAESEVGACEKWLHGASRAGPTG